MTIMDAAIALYGELPIKCGETREAALELWRAGMRGDETEGIGPLISVLYAAAEREGTLEIVPVSDFWRSCSPEIQKFKYRKNR